jgi:CubicO group peptidase (beta-lactamase class C family)
MIDASLRYFVWSESRSGFVAAFARDGVPVHATSVGWANVERQEPMALDTRMRFASMTKALTAVSALILVEEGKLGLDDPVMRYIPAIEGVRVATSHSRNAEGGFDTVAADPIPTVRHLLMFSSGVGPGMTGPSDLAEHWSENGLRATETGTLAERVERLVQLPLFEQPGEMWRYGGSADVLARVVEVAAGEPFGDFMARRIIEPLGMDSTSFLPSPSEQAGMATVYTQDADGELVPAQARIDAADWTPGGSGLVSTAGDYMRFALMLWNQGEYDGVRILETATVVDMMRPHMPSGVLATSGGLDAPDIQGLGWGLGLSIVVDSEQTPFSDRDGDAWWGGYYGTTFFVSRESGLVGVILSQNEPGPHSDIPIALYVAQALAFAGL